MKASKQRCEERRGCGENGGGEGTEEAGGVTLYTPYTARRRGAAE